MRQTDFLLGPSITRRDLKTVLAAFGHILRVDQRVTLGIAREALKEQEEINFLFKRSRHIHAIYFNLNALSEHECVSRYRFQKAHMGLIVQAVGWKAGITKRNRYRCDPLTATCVVLRKLAGPIRWYEVEKEFGMRTSHLSEVFWEVTEQFMELRGHLLDIRQDLLRDRADAYSTGIKNLGAALEKCVGFLDCTKIRMCRPGGASMCQRSVYSGHRRMHCLMYMTITTPDGLISALHGPIEGRRHDLTLFRQSGWEADLEHLLLIDGIQHYVYADSAFTIRPYLQVPFGTVGATLQQVLFNRAMSGVRVAVEWNYKDLKQMWSTNDYSRLLKVRQAPIGLIYKASALMLNLRTCIYKGGQAGSYFEVKAPSISEYLNDA